MPAYAILGATGNVGRSLLETLLPSSDNTIHAFVRSKSKLTKQVPEIENTQHVQIYEGDISKIDVLVECLTGVQTVFLAVAATGNVPGCSIAQDTAKAVVEALDRLRKNTPSVKLPRLVVLSSATTNAHLVRNIPTPFRVLLHTALSYVYDDLELAEKYLRREKERLGVAVTFMKPAALVQDERKGHELSLDISKSGLSFLDLAGGMVEVADTDGDRWDGKDVSVLSKGSARLEWWVPFLLLKGLLIHFFPGLYPYLG